ncbi:MAG: metallophosphoesterase [Bacteroidota bacterium]
MIKNQVRMNQAKPFRFLQISDLHLHPDENYTYNERLPLLSFKAVLADIQALNPKPDFLLFSGDIASDKQEEVYLSVDQMIQATGFPYYWIGGNHDDPELMARLADRLDVHSVPHFIHQQWHFILLDSVAKDRKGSYGEFSKKDLKNLARALEGYPDLPSLLVMHHHFLPTGFPWMDNSTLKDAETFLKLVNKFPQVKAILHGHIHQDKYTNLGGIQIWACPSTAYQFKPQAEFALDDIAPGYRIFDLEPNGSIRSEVRRVTI